MNRPLLMANDRRYCGPWVPVHDMAGKISVRGLSGAEADELVVRLESIRRVDERVFTQDGDYSYVPEPGLMAQAERVRSSGVEVFVWVS